MRVMIVGKGKMGTRLAASAAEKGHALVATVDRFNREALGSLACDAVIDFSHPDNLAWVCDYVEQQCCIPVKAAMNLMGMEVGGYAIRCVT